MGHKKGNFCNKKMGNFHPYLYLEIYSFILTDIISI